MITRLGLSHPRDHKFKHGFQDCLNSLCSDGIEVGTIAHCLLHCLNNLHERKTLLDNIKSTLVAIILNATINYITSAKRFNDSMFTFYKEQLKIKGKDKTIHVYLLSKSFSDILHHQCY